MNARYALTYVLCVSTVGCASIPDLTNPTSEENEKLDSVLRERRHARAETERAAAAVDQRKSDLEHATEAVRKRSDANAGPRQRHAEQTHEYERYAKAITTALEIGSECKNGDLENIEKVPALYLTLKPYIAEEERDKAIAVLDACRKRIARSFEKRLRSTASESRRDFAEGVEDRFDENNPWSKGQLVALVKGDQLHIRMRGNFEGRRRHSQNQVDTWCESPGSEFFSTITLRNSHGQFSCKPAVSLDDIIEQQIARAELNRDWRIEGERPTPVEPQPLPPPPLHDPTKNLVAEKDAATEGLKQAKEQLETARDSEKATERTVTRVNNEIETRIYNDVQDATNQAKGLKLGGLTVGGLGALAVVGGATLAAGEDSGNRPAGFALIGVGATAAAVGLVVALVGISRLKSLEALDLGRVAFTYPTIAGLRTGGSVSFGLRF